MANPVVTFEMENGDIMNNGGRQSDEGRAVSGSCTKYCK